LRAAIDRTAKWMARGLTVKPDFVAELVSDFNERQLLSTLGYEFKMEDLNCIEAEIFFVIQKANDSVSKMKNRKIK